MKNVLVVGGGTAGAVLASRLSEDSNLSVCLLEAGADDESYHPSVLDPARTYEVWQGSIPLARADMASSYGNIEALQGRVLGGTSAVNASATLRGQPADYDAWRTAGLEGWSWNDVRDTFIQAEADMDFGATSLHGDSGPLPVRRWRRDEHTEAHRAFMDGMVAGGTHHSVDINDPAELPGVGVFPATIDSDSRRVTTSIAYLDQGARSRPNLRIRTGAAVASINIDKGRATGVTLVSGEQMDADEVVLAAGALYSPTLLLRSGIGPADHLADHGIAVHADLPVGSTMSDHLGPAVYYSHAGPRGGAGGPAQVVMVGASRGSEIDYHLFPLHLAETEDNRTEFQVVAFLLRSSGLGSVRLGESIDAEPVVCAPPMPDDTEARLSHAFQTLVAWEQSDAARAIDLQRLAPVDLSGPDAVRQAMEMGLISYFHMTSTCPMGPVLDADCRVKGIDGLRVADASVMPSIPAGNTYLGCVMVAERVAAKMKAAAA